MKNVKKRICFVLALAATGFIAAVLFFSYEDADERTLGLAAFSPPGAPGQASQPCAAAQDDAFYMIIQEITAFGFPRNDELISNDELYAFATQIELMRRHINESAVITQRRGIAMEPTGPVASLPLYGPSRQPWSCDTLLAYALTASLELTCDNQVQRLVDALIYLGEICADYNRFNLTMELMLGMLPTRQALSCSELYFLYELEAFMAMVNAPFWGNMYAFDPVITHIGVPVGSPLGCSYFTIWLYNPSLKCLTDDQLADYTTELRNEILKKLENVGANPYRFEFRVNQCGEYI